MSTTQKVLVVTAIGQPVTSVPNWPIPVPGPKQIQLRITVGGLNPHDQKARDIGVFIKDDLPAILGNDVVGVVTALGEGASRFKVGDRVFGQAHMKMESKALQEYAVLDEDYAARVPKGVSEDEAATLPTNIIADVVAFFDPSHLAIPAPWNKQGNVGDIAFSAILIIGGGSNCGRFATQLASLSGFSTIVVIGGLESELKSYGATHIVDRHGGHDTVLARIRDIVGDELVYAFDAVSPPSEQHLAVNALSNSKKGKLARLVWSRGSVAGDKILAKKEGYELKNVMGVSHNHPDVTVPFWRVVGDWLVQRKIRPTEYVSVEGLDVQKVNEVLDRYRDGEKVVQPHFRVST
ncbi:GroES-like protein [Setomelanomma holmii]|uniref:GroES-like protein n=1 Tax=Setomelanomma holmii TaxID=210430 RepID=A0A9P4LQD4_9PLEO|nr:GroES-like protein [Setomelanomma holmii]